MSLIRDAAATALGTALAARVVLAQPPTVVNAPPSERTKYPAVAILIDKTDIAYSTDDDLQVDTTQTFGHAGYVLDGTFRTSDVDDSYIDGNAYVAPGGKTISHIGSLRCTGRIWVGTRLAKEREQIERDIWLAFFGERAAPGRLQLPIPGVDIGGVNLPFGIATALVSGSTWTPEQAFTERLWAYLAFDLDVPLLVPRTDPIVSQLILEISRDFTATITQPSDVAKLPDLQKYSVDSNGNPTLTTT